MTINKDKNDLPHSQDYIALEDYKALHTHTRQAEQVLLTGKVNQELLTTKAQKVNQSEDKPKETKE